MSDPSSGQKSDHDLILEVQKGSMQSFNVLHDRYSRQIMVYVYNMLGQRQYSEDVTQDVFVKMYTKARQYKLTGKFSAWLYQIARNTTLNFIRNNKSTLRQKSLDAEPGDSQGVRSMENVLKDTSDAGKDLVTSEHIEMIRKGLSELSPQDREMIVLCDIESLQHREVAYMLGFAEDGFNVRLQRARQRLKKILGLNEDLIQEP